VNGASRRARLLVRLYPAWWRARYGEEFHGLLADHGLSLRCVGDVASAAVVARVRGDRAAPLADRRRGALAAALWSGAVFVPIGAGFARMGDPPNSPLWVATNAHPLAKVGLVLVVFCVFAIGLLALFVAIIVVLPAVREAWRTRRRDLIRPLAAMTAAVLLVTLSFVALYINATTLTRAQMQGSAPWPATAKLAVAACLAVWLVALTLFTGGAARLVRRTRAVDPEDLAILACFFVLFTAAGVIGVITWGAALLIQAPRAFGTGPTAGWTAMVILALALAATSALAALARTGTASQ
jgi:MFS family permease